MNQFYQFLSSGRSCLFALLVLAFPASAQKSPIKYDEVSVEEVSMENYALDSNANAVVLADIGDSYFKWSSENEQFEIFHVRQCRVKIFNKAAFDDATVVIPYYDGTEKFLELKGKTFLLENGKVAEYKLDNKAIFDEKVDGKLYRKKFTMPNIKEGAVFEFTYTIRSTNTTFFREWEFQQRNPVIWSEYTARIPEYYDYKLEMSGFNPLFISQQKSGSSTYLISWSAVSDNGVTSGQRAGSETVTAKVTDYRWVIKDVPAFADDQFITTPDDYISKIKFQLQGVKFPESPYRGVLNTWEKVTEAIYNGSGFVNAMNSPGSLKEQLKSIVDQYPSEVERAIAIASYLKKNVKWNGDNGIFASQSAKSLWEKKNGSSNEINLLLVGMLREAGLEANPVLISTRAHGRVNMYYPMVDNFNYVLASVQLDSVDVLLDATDPARPANLLPEFCLNGQGRLLTKEISEGRWIQLENHKIKAKRITLGNLQLNDNRFKGSLISDFRDYEAASVRTALMSSSADEYLEKTFKSNGFKVIKHNFENVDDVYSPLKVQLDFESEDELESPALLYINPVVYGAFTENHFRAKSRTYPVSFPTTKEEMYNMTIDIPQGYAVEELPQSVRFNLSGDGARFLYTIGQVDDKVQLRMMTSFNKTLFLPEEYEGLKTFFSAIIAKQQEQIVLKKLN